MGEFFDGDGEHHERQIRGECFPELVGEGAQSDGPRFAGVVFGPDVDGVVDGVGESGDLLIRLGDLGWGS